MTRLRKPLLRTLSLWFLAAGTLGGAGCRDHKEPASRSAVSPASPAGAVEQSPPVGIAPKPAFEPAAVDASAAGVAHTPGVRGGEREFQPEGPAGALRLTFDDLDVKQLLNRPKVTLDVPELLPQWLQDLTA